MMSSNDPFDFQEYLSKYHPIYNRLKPKPAPSVASPAPDPDGTNLSRTGEPASEPTPTVPLTPARQAPKGRGQTTVFGVRVTPEMKRQLEEFSELLYADGKGPRKNECNIAALVRLFHEYQHSIPIL